MTECVNCAKFKGCDLSSPNVNECADYKEILTNEEWLRSATFEEMAGAIYEWHTKGYARGRLEVDLNPITEVVEWLKQPHTVKEYNDEND